MVRGDGRVFLVGDNSGVLCRCGEREWEVISVWSVDSGSVCFIIFTRRISSF